MPVSGALEARAAAAAEARVRDIVARLAERIAATAPEVSVHAEAGRLVLSGRRLASDPALRWIGGLAR